MQLDQPWAKFCLKSDLNHILIDFFDSDLLVPTIQFEIGQELDRKI